MSDIVERLKEGESCQIEGGMPCKEISFKGGCLCAEAAAEIERLLACVAELEGALKEIEWQNAPGSEWCVARARAALKTGDKP